MNHSPWERLADLVVRRSRLVLALLGVVTVFFAACLLRLDIGTNLKLFQRQESRDLIRVIEDDFGEKPYHAVIFESQTGESLLTPKNLKQQFRTLGEIKKRFRVTTESLVDGIDEGLRRTKRKSILDVTDYKEIGEALLAISGGRTVLDLEKVSRHMLSHPEAVGFYAKFRISARVSGMGAAGSQWSYEIPYVKAIQAYVQLEPTYTEKEEKETVAAIRNLAESLQAPDMKVHVYGEDLISYDIDYHSGKNAFWMAFMVLAVDFLLFWGIFKSRREVFIMLAVMGTSCLWTFGLAALLGIRISFLHLIALPILMGTGDDDDMIFGRRLAEEREKTGDLPQALRATYAGTGRGIFLTTFTTFLAFLVSAVTTSSEAIASFNLLVALSMLICLSVTLLLQGSLRAELEKWRGKKSFGGIWGSVSSGIMKLANGLSGVSARWLANRPRWVLSVAALLFVVSLALLLRLQSEFDPKIFIRRTMPTYQAERIQEKYFGHPDYGYLLIDGEVENPRLLQKLKLLEEKMASLPYMEVILGKAHVDSVQQLIEKRKIPLTDATPVRAVFDEILESKGSEETANYVLNETYRESARHLLRKTGGRYDGVLMKFFAQAEARGDKVAVLHEGIAREMEALGFNEIPGIRARIGGGSVSFHLEEIYYFQNFIRSFFLSLLLIFIVLLAVWRRFWSSVMAMIPMLFSVTLTVGVMVLAGFTLNVLNLTIGSIIVGLGVDYSIHVIERFEEERLRDATLTRLQAARLVVLSMGPNILAVALTTIGGFASSCILVMPIAVSFGALTAIAVFFVYLASIFILPVLLALPWDRQSLLK